MSRSRRTVPQMLAPLIGIVLWVCADLPQTGHAAEETSIPPAVSRTVDFGKDVRPLLEAKCFGCHGAGKQLGGLRLDRAKQAREGGDSGAVIVPGKSESSLLIQLVAGVDKDRIMPEKGERLTAEQIGILRAWIDAGAKWPEEGIDNDAPTHWSLMPIQRPSVPAGREGDLNEIDRFVSSKLAEQGLSRSAPASRRTLARRLHFDLIGLPPTMESVDRFMADTDPAAYEKLVESLLASPRHGERWARHWLDVVRFAESDGFETNKPRANAWHYRDYVIDSFNSDKPYDLFLMEQLAGDLLGAEAALGFITGGALDVVKSPDPVLTSQQRADLLHDMVSTTSSAFLGLTVGCARCHNHKFDPIPQADYYAIKAVFEGTDHGERPLTRRDDGPDRESRLAALRGELARVDGELLQFEPLANPDFQPAKAGSQSDAAHGPNRSSVHPRWNVDRFAPVMARRLRFTITASSGAEPCLDELEVYSAAVAASTDGKATEPTLKPFVPRNIALSSAGTKAFASSTLPNFAIHKLEHVNDGLYGNSRSWISAEPGRGWVELEFTEPVLIDTVQWGRDREEKFADRLATQYTISVSRLSRDEAKAASGGGKSDGKDSANDSASEWKVVAGSNDRQAYVAGKKFVARYESNEGLTAEQRGRIQELLKQRSSTESDLKRLTERPMVYAAVFTPQPPATRRFHRGDPMQPREPVEPAALRAVPARFELGGRPEATPEQQRRLALARWMVDPANPLTARVIVNRLWQFHFGEGIVATPSDFGANGAKPTHRELLDWLAAELRDHGWSLRHIHRLIVTSATYRQASSSRADALSKDAGNRWLWRYSPRRLEAEALRDAILATSGQLDLRAGGPGFLLFEPNSNYVRVYTPKQQFQPDDFRRMIYMTKIRMHHDDTFGAFDCPDAGQIAPKRSSSTTPLQALNLLNSPFLVGQSESFGKRLVEREPSLPEQIRRAFFDAYQRDSTREEQAACEELARNHGLAAVCRVLFNSNEFLFVE